MAQLKFVDFICSFFKLDEIDYNFLSRISFSLDILSFYFYNLEIISSFSLLLFSILFLVFLMI